MANSLVYEESCQTPLQNLTLDRTPFNFSSNTDLFIWYNCTENPPQYGTYPINCYSNATLHSFAGFHKDVLVNANYSFESCQSFAYAPVHLDNGVDLASLGSMNYTEILKMGFLLNWTAHSCSNCEASGGRCGFSNNEFVCFCEDRPHLKTCDDGNSSVHLPFFFCLLLDLVSSFLFALLWLSILWHNSSSIFAILYHIVICYYDSKMLCI